MRYAVIALGVLLLATPCQSVQAATLIPLNSGISAIVFSQSELPTISPDQFACDRHIYQADQSYTPLPNALYHTTKHAFGVYNNCYLVPSGRMQTLVSNRKIMRFLPASQPDTEIVLEITGDGLSPLTEGTYQLKNGGSVTIDAKNQSTRPIRP